MRRSLQASSVVKLNGRWALVSSLLGVTFDLLTSPSTFAAISGVVLRGRGRFSCRVRRNEKALPSICPPLPLIGAQEIKNKVSCGSLACSTPDEPHLKHDEQVANNGAGPCELSLK